MLYNIQEIISTLKIKNPIQTSIQLIYRKLYHSFFAG